MGGESLGPGSTTHSLIESIEYEEPGFKGPGTCLHSRDELEVYPTGYVRHASRYNTIDKRTETYKVERDDGYLATKYASFIGTGNPIIVRNERWAQWSSDAMEALLPTFSERGGESLVNAALELGQLKQLFTHWRKPIATLKKLHYNWIKLRTELEKPRKKRFKRIYFKYISGKATIKELAASHLNIQFGWVPFVSDVRRCYDALENFRKKVRELQDRAGTPQRVHYARAVDTADIPSDTTNTDSIGTRRRKTRWITSPKYVATVDFIYVLPDMSSMTNQAKAFLDTLGVQGNPRILWDAVPYSFVIDWFVGVGDWLNKLRTDNLRIPATVTGFCHSLKYEYDTTYTLTIGPNAGLLYPEGSGAEILLARRRGLRYKRLRDIPSTGVFNTTVRAPSWGKVAVATSLMIGRL